MGEQEGSLSSSTVQEQGRDGARGSMGPGGRRAQGWSGVSVVTTTTYRSNLLNSSSSSCEWGVRAPRWPQVRKDGYVHWHNYNDYCRAMQLLRLPCRWPNCHAVTFRASRDISGDVATSTTGA